MIFAVPRFRQQRQIAQHSLVTDEGDAQLGFDIELAGRLQLGDFLGHRFEQYSVLAEFIRQLERLLVNDNLALFRQFDDDIEDGGSDLGVAQLARGQGLAADFRDQPAICD